MMYQVKNMLEMSLLFPKWHNQFIFISVSFWFNTVYKTIFYRLGEK